MNFATIIGTIGLTISLYRLYRIARVIKKGETTVGRIAEIIEVRNTETNSFDQVPIWEYLTKDGQVIMNAKVFTGTVPYKLKINETQKIYYQKSDPFNALIEYRGSDYLILPILFAALAFVFLLLGLLSSFFSK